MEEEELPVAAAAAVAEVVEGQRGLWCGWAELGSKVKMVGARGIGRVPGAAFSLSLLRASFRRLDCWW